MKMTRLLGCMTIGFLVTAAAMLPAQATRADAEKDPVLRAMLAEMDRSKSKLQLSGFEKPFFLEYRVEDAVSFETKAEFGASEGMLHNHQRIARITVLVGDYKTDSSGVRGEGAVQMTSISDDPVAIRCALWVATDQAYKNALAAYAQKQAELKQVQTLPQADDFSHQKPAIVLEAPAQLKIDDASWVARVAHDSGIYRTDPTVKANLQDVQYSVASFNARARTTRIVNSEGTIVRQGVNGYQEAIALGTQAADGMRLDRSYASSGETLADLDTPEVLQKHAVALITSLTALRNAPLVDEEYHGPVLLSADASADVLHNLLGGAVVATRPKLGTEARTNGPFASSYRARVLSESMDVVDDPKLRSFEGHGMVGAYDVDEEGVPAQTVKLVGDGILDSYLIGRQPVKDFPESNGHGRGGVTSPTHPAIGVLKVTMQNGVSDEELNRKLLEQAKALGLKDVYYVDTMGAPNTPRLLYRIGLDGKRELVRGAVLDDLDQRALRSSIEAAGNKLWVANYMGDVPETVLAPALLINDVTVKRANEKNGKLPFYPPPS